MDVERTCILCGKSHIVHNTRYQGRLCPDCRTPEREHEYVRVRIALHAARKRGLPATLTLPEWLCILDHFGQRCAYCRHSKFELLEHITALNAGGGTTATNCVPACISCNRRKDSRLLADPLPTYKIERVKAELAIGITRRLR